MPERQGPGGDRLRVDAGGRELWPRLVPAMAGALLCAIALGSRSLWLDEGATIAYTSQHGAALWAGIKHDGGNMLLYYLLIHVWRGLFGTDVWVLRLPSLLSLAAVGWLTAELSLEVLPGRARIACVSGLLTVASLPLVFWGQDIRGYELMVALTAASMLGFLRVLLASSRVPISAWLLYGLSTLAALYVGFDAGLVVLAQLAVLGGVWLRPDAVTDARRRVLALIGLLVVVGVLSVPLAVLAVERGSSQLFWVAPLSFSVGWQALVTLVSAGMPPNFHDSWLTVVIVVITLAALLPALRDGLGWGEPGSGPTDPTPAGSGPPAGTRSASASGEALALRTLALWVLAPTIVGLLVAVAGKPIELSRCAIMLMPAVSILLVWKLRGTTIAWSSGLALLVLLFVLRLVAVIPQYGVSPEPWNLVANRLIGTVAKTGWWAYPGGNGGRLGPNPPSRGPALRGRECLVFYPQDGRNVFDYYLLHSPDAARAEKTLTPVLPNVPWTDTRAFVEDYATLTSAQLAGVAQSCPVVYLIASHEGQPRNAPAASIANYRSYLTLKRSLGGFYADVHTDSYGWAAKIHVTEYSGPVKAVGAAG